MKVYIVTKVTEDEQENVGAFYNKKAADAFIEKRAQEEGEDAKDFQVESLPMQK